MEIIFSQMVMALSRLLHVKALQAKRGTSPAPSPTAPARAVSDRKVLFITPHSKDDFSGHKPQGRAVRELSEVPAVWGRTQWPAT